MSPDCREGCSGRREARAEGLLISRRSVQAKRATVTRRGRSDQVDRRGYCSSEFDRLGFLIAEPIDQGIAIAPAIP